MRKLAVVICLFTLAACGQANTPATEAPAATTEAQSNGQGGSVLLSTPQGLPDWLLVLRTNDGGTIHFNQRTISRDGNFADIWLQIRYGRQQAWDASDATTERTIRYDVERMHYRYNCTDETFVVVERQIMGANDEVVARDEPRQIYRAAPAGGAAAHMLPIACRGA